MQKVSILFEIFRYSRVKIHSIPLIRSSAICYIYLWTSISSALELDHTMYWYSRNKGSQSATCDNLINCYPSVTLQKLFPLNRYFIPLAYERPLLHNLHASITGHSKRYCDRYLIAGFYRFADPLGDTNKEPHKKERKKQGQDRKVISLDCIRGNFLFTVRRSKTWEMESESFQPSCAWTLRELPTFFHEFQFSLINLLDNPLDWLFDDILDILSSGHDFFKIPNTLVKIEMPLKARVLTQKV